jgi:hypothetical protein
MKDTQILDIQKIIKRLILIKGLISLEEEEEILDQVVKLLEMHIDNEVEVIVNHIKQQAYGKATSLIDKYIHKYNQLAFFVDPEIEALRFEAKTLEKQIQELNNEKSELDKLIHEFSVRHNQELGELILKILSYRKEQSKGTPEFKEAEKDYSDYFSNYESSKDLIISTLTSEEQKELKEKYRKATKLCHPVIVDQDQKEAAHKIFIELKDAYERNDLKKVTEILNFLQQGKAFTSKADAADEKSVLQQEIERVRYRLNELQVEIAIIKSSDTFITITNIKDWDLYFSETKQRLQSQLSEMNHEQ